MATDYSRSVLRVVVAQVCQQLGWHAVQSTPLELLTDMMERYVLDLGRFTHRYADQFGRTEPDLDDMGLAMQEMGINLEEIIDFTQHMDPMPFCSNIPKYPVECPPHLHFPKSNSRELVEREEHISDHYPPLHPEWDEEMVEVAPAAPDTPPPSQQAGEGTTPGTPGVGGDKRRLPGTPGATPPDKIPRMLPDEASHSRYEMRSVTLSNSGVLTPTRHGKLPEATVPLEPATPTISSSMPVPPLPTRTCYPDGSHLEDEVDMDIDQEDGTSTSQTAKPVHKKGNCVQHSSSSRPSFGKSKNNSNKSKIAANKTPIGKSTKSTLHGKTPIKSTSQKSKSKPDVPNFDDLSLLKSPGPECDEDKSSLVIDVVAGQVQEATEERKHRLALYVETINYVAKQSLEAASEEDALKESKAKEAASKKDMAPPPTPETKKNKKATVSSPARKQLAPQANKEEKDLHMDDIIASVIAGGDMADEPSLNDTGPKDIYDFHDDDGDFGTSGAGTPQSEKSIKLSSKSKTAKKKTSKPMVEVPGLLSETVSEYDEPVTDLVVPPAEVPPLIEEVDIKTEPELLEPKEDPVTEVVIEPEKEPAEAVEAVGAVEDVKPPDDEQRAIPSIRIEFGGMGKDKLTIKLPVLPVKEEPDKTEHHEKRKKEKKKKKNKDKDREKRDKHDKDRKKDRSKEKERKKDKKKDKTKEKSRDDGKPQTVPRLLFKFGGTSTASPTVTVSTGNQENSESPEKEKEKKKKSKTKHSDIPPPPPIPTLPPAPSPPTSRKSSSPPPAEEKSPLHSPEIPSPSAASPEIPSPGIPSRQMPSPEVLSPGAPSPELPSPGAASPEILSPSAHSPEVLSPIAPILHAHSPSPYNSPKSEVDYTNSPLKMAMGQSPIRAQFSPAKSENLDEIPSLVGLFPNSPQRDRDSFMPTHSPSPSPPSSPVQPPPSLKTELGDSPMRLSTKPSPSSSRSVSPAMSAHQPIKLSPVHDVSTKQEPTHDWPPISSSLVHRDSDDSDDWSPVGTPHIHRSKHKESTTNPWPATSTPIIGKAKTKTETATDKSGVSSRASKAKSKLDSDYDRPTTNTPRSTKAKAKQSSEYDWTESSTPVKSKSKAKSDGTSPASKSKSGKNRHKAFPGDDVSLAGTPRAGKAKPKLDSDFDWSDTSTPRSSKHKSKKDTADAWSPRTGKGKSKKKTHEETPPDTGKSKSKPESASDLSSKSKIKQEPSSDVELSGGTSKSAKSKSKDSVEEEENAGVFTETQGTIKDDDGQIIWICPACKYQDDGSPMIGCDLCDDWYHWECVGITVEPPEDEKWYCPRCSAKNMKAGKNKMPKVVKKKRKLIKKK